MSEEIFAFPRHTSQAMIDEYAGMTLRDWFAGQAFMGLIACRSGGFPNEAAKTAYLLADAKTAYLLADAMLKAREVSKR